MVATMFPQSHGLTPSACWTFGTRASCGRGPTPASLEDKHAVAMEDGRSACVINQYDDIRFLNLRKTPPACAGDQPAVEAFTR